MASLAGLMHLDLGGVDKKLEVADLSFLAGLLALLMVFSCKAWFSWAWIVISRDFNCLGLTKSLILLKPCLDTALWTSGNIDLLRCNAEITT